MTGKLCSHAFINGQRHARTRNAAGLAIRSMVATVMVVTMVLLRISLVVIVVLLEVAMSVIEAAIMVLQQNKLIVPFRFVVQVFFD